MLSFCDAGVTILGSSSRISRQSWRGDNTGCCLTDPATDSVDASRIRLELGVKGSINFGLFVSFNDDPVLMVLERRELLPSIQIAGGRVDVFEFQWLATCNAEFC